ncbi:MAG TPA: isoleucine--tRNA ligase [Candidatus Thalassarchaeaceae archaeon]|nr:isoleucine--tRNA ligase [Candidatus Thalassarchaeaceae archaeon]|tara:strand:- start:10412 stop:13597 length:3186 start_codon:yes stop_codon:yes gene_type:complete
MGVPSPPGELDPVALENSLMGKWEEEGTFSNSIESRRKYNSPFTFLEGPPTANGRPGIHHVISRLFKDMVCRWKAMEGYVVERKGGWDTHGLPVEIEVQKRLDLMSNEAIEEYGMEAFNQKCKESVWTYEEAWREMTERMAFWVDMDDPYVTLHDEYIESAWWSLKQMFDKGLLFKGHKVLPYCPQTGTSYSTHEVSLGYKEVAEPAVFVKFRLEDDDASILAWTTTPWTLPGNVGLAVGPDVTYCRVRITESPSNSWEGRGGAEIGEELILAKDLIGNVLRNQAEIVDEFLGSKLVGKAYSPLFPGAIERGESVSAWTVVAADFVTTTDGTGVVHTAVMYGEDDYRLGMQVGLPAQHTVGMDGAFVEGVHDLLDGRYVKDCDDDIINLLEGLGLLYREHTYTHDYPHCWRTDHPLLYYAMDSWFVRMTAVRDEILTHNASVEWAPEWTGTKRMGEWLSNIKDWAISRERYWGTPIPVWICSECDTVHCVGSIGEMSSMKTESSPMPPELHRPYVDEVRLNCPSDECSGEMIREPYVMDCWFDSGCASFAQWHYPFENEDKFDGSFPVDYICEAVDQTRGWFYSLLAVATTVFGEPCFRRCLSLGHILDKDGKKMSKSRGNVVNPWDHFNKEGADSIRWYMTTQSAPWSPTNFDPNGVRESYAKMFLTLWNVYRFHSDYASLDGFDPEHEPGFVAVSDRSPLDRWVLSRMTAMADEYSANFDSWDFHKAGRILEDFVVNDVSNWYVRRSRRRLWDEADSNDKRACQHTLHEVLLVVCRLMAPVSPFMPDEIHRGLTGTSAHLADWPVGSSLVPRTLPSRDKLVEQQMALVRSLAEAGRRIRVDSNRRQRLPCRTGWIVGGPNLADFHETLAEELNVESLDTGDDLDAFQRIVLEPNRKSLGSKCRSDLPSVLAQLDLADPEALLLEIEAGIAALGGYEITKDDIEIRRVEKQGFAAQTLSFDEGDVSIVLDMDLDADLLSKGLARDITRRIQAKRKELDLDVESTIELSVWVEGLKLAEEDWNHVQRETRTGTASLNSGKRPSGAESFEVDGTTVFFSIAN